jgi:hypothetical protein
MRCRSKTPCGLSTISEIDVNYRQDFVTSMHCNFLQGQTDSGLCYWPYHSGQLRCPNQKIVVIVTSQAQLLSLLQLFVAVTSVITRLFLSSRPLLSLLSLHISCG